MKKAYLFDFDGTLVDSMPTFVRAMLRILDENDIKYDESVIKIITPLGVLGTAKYYKELGVKGEIEDIIGKMKEYMYEEYLHTIPAKSNVEMVIRKLKQNGAKLSVLTASPHATLDPCIKRLGLFELFDNVWSCDDFATSKADPQIYVMAAERMGVSVGEVLFLDDNYNADLTAKKAGVQVCAVYDKSSEDFVEEMKAVADYYIYDFLELLNIE